MSSLEELHMLIGGYLDGHSTPDELAALAQRLASDAVAARTFTEVAMTDVLLEQYFHDAGMDATADALLQSQRRRLQALRAFPTTGEYCLDTDRAQAGAPAGRRDALGVRYVVAASLLVVLVGAAALVVHWSTRASSVASPAAAQPNRHTLATIERTMLVQPTGGEAVAAGSRIAPGQSIRINSGLVEVRLDAGASLILKGPAHLQFLSPLQAILHRGTVTAKVDQSAHGFRVDTPHANVVDLGTEFGVSVTDGGETDVVVFAGKVKMHVPSVGSAADAVASAVPPATSSRLLRSGDALRVNSGGSIRRLVAIDSSQFPTSVTTDDNPAAASPILTVSDNLRENDTTKCYRIVPGGLAEDAAAYVDRSHEWNGVDERGIPSFLLGADYVMPFNDDKLVDRLEVKLLFARPALLYIFLDDRVPTPEWIQQRFQNTGSKIGLDEGNYPNAEKETDVGAGQSIDNVCSIWVTKVDAASSLTLDALGATEEFCAMYGIAVTALGASE